ncbi:MAG: hypothetical protein JWO59_2886 [Chloroflexi bacterium]|nr:hypothetical protein [Chloroflexota bacterium]
MIYCASRREGAFGETIARFRPDLTLLARLKEITDSTPDNLEQEMGKIPADWRSKRTIGVASLDSSLLCVDLATGESIQYFREVLAPIGVRLGLPDIDLSTFTTSKRPLTQAAARHIYELKDQQGNPQFDGIRYISRLNSEWECWAFFDARIRFSTVNVENILANDSALRSVARLFKLTIEP